MVFVILVLSLAALYLFLIHPRVVGRKRMESGLYFAHRGLHDNGSDAPENTLAAFRRAVEAGYGMELDVQLTADDRVVVAHDLHLKRICGVDRTIDSLTYDDLQQYTVMGSGERIPLFSQVLELVDGKVPLIVEIKMKDSNCHVCEKADELLRQYKGAYCVESFHPAAVNWFRVHRPELCRGQLSTNYRRHDGKNSPVLRCMTLLMTNFKTRPDFVAYDCRDYKSASLWLCRSIFRCPGYAWTVKSQAQLDRIRGSFDYYIFEGFIPE